MNRKAKNHNKLESSTMQTGGHVVHHSREHDPIVKVPQKATGDVSGEKMGGLAKASPFFQPLEEIEVPATPAAEQKAIAESTVEEVKDEEVDEDNQ